jgi:hypothetical protein
MTVNSPCPLQGDMVQAYDFLGTQARPYHHRIFCPVRVPRLFSMTCRSMFSRILPTARIRAAQSSSLGSSRYSKTRKG